MAKLNPFYHDFPNRSHFRAIRCRATHHRTAVAHPVGPALHFGDRPALVFMGFSITYNTLTDLVNRVTAFCPERLAAYKVPKQIEFVAELPHESIRKILKQYNRLLPKK